MRASLVLASNINTAEERMGEEGVVCGDSKEWKISGVVFTAEAMGEVKASIMASCCRDTLNA